MTADLLAQLQELRDEVKSGATSVAMLLDTLDPAEAALLRKCAITHQFTPEILCVLEPALTKDAAQAQYDEISGLSMVIRTPDGLGLHDHARAELFPAWLEPARRDELVAISRRLADYFSALMTIDPAHLQKYRRRYVFHLIGADQRAGYKAFRETYDEYRQHLLYTFCVNLVRLVHEYDPILAPDLKRDLTYREGKLTLDRDDAEGALNILDPLANDPETPPLLRIKVLNRIGTAWCDLRRPKAAATVLDEAAHLAEANGALRDWGRVLLNLAHISSDSGDLDRAETLLNRSIELARQVNDPGGIANALNSLGSVDRRAGDHARAIHHYEESLEYIHEEDFDRARIYNNIANCYMDLREWDKSETYLQRSLEKKVNGGDVGGQANTYVNLAKLNIARGDRPRAIEAAKQAATLFAEVSNWYEVGQAKRALARILGDGPDMQTALREAMDAFGRAKAQPERNDAEAELQRISRVQQSSWTPAKKATVAIIGGIVLLLIALLLVVAYFAGAA